MDLTIGILQFFHFIFKFDLIDIFAIGRIECSARYGLGALNAVFQLVRYLEHSIPQCQQFTLQRSWQLQLGCNDT